MKFARSLSPPNPTTTPDSTHVKSEVTEPNATSGLSYTPPNNNTQPQSHPLHARRSASPIPDSGPYKRIKLEHTEGGEGVRNEGALPTTTSSDINMADVGQCGMQTIEQQSTQPQQQQQIPVLTPQLQQHEENTSAIANAAQAQLQDQVQLQQQQQQQQQRLSPPFSLPPVQASSIDFPHIESGVAQQQQQQQSSVSADQFPLMMTPTPSPSEERNEDGTVPTTTTTTATAADHADTTMTSSAPLSSAASAMSAILTTEPPTTPPPPRGAAKPTRPWPPPLQAPADASASLAIREIGTRAWRGPTEGRAVRTLGPDRREPSNPPGSRADGSPGSGLRVPESSSGGATGDIFADLVTKRRTSFVPVADRPSLSAVAKHERKAMIRANWMQISPDG
ncbi:hypothetical protein HK102_008953, partial [Quaeritorhiza haematococci]